MTRPIRALQEMVSQRFAVPLEVMLGSSTKRAVVRARHIAMLLAHETIGLSGPQIAGAFGDRDPSSVHAALSKIQSRIAYDPELAADVAGLRQALKSPRDTADQHRNARLDAATSQIGDCVARLGMLRAQQHDSGQGIAGQIAIGLERAAAYVLGQGFEEYARARAAQYAESGKDLAPPRQPNVEATAGRTESAVSE